MMPRQNQAISAATPCEEVLDLLHAFVSNELEVDEIRPMLLHLGECESCRAAMAEHVKIIGVLRANMPSLVRPYFTRHRGARH